MDDLLYTDDTGAQFIYRDSGTTPPVFTAYLVPSGAAYTVGANPRPYAVDQGRDATGVTAPAGGSGVRGWLSGSYSRLSGIGDQSDVRVTWYDVSGSLLSRLALLIASSVDAGSHVYGYTAGNLTTDAWTLFGVTHTKTYTYTGGFLTAESDWV